MKRIIWGIGVFLAIIIGIGALTDSPEIKVSPAKSGAPQEELAPQLIVETKKETKDEVTVFSTKTTYNSSLAIGSSGFQ